jgi:NAD(P)-dependent dehydrogenase (short-subunit alcohol dehydrogenase family)
MGCVVAACQASGGRRQRDPGWGRIVNVTTSLGTMLGAAFPTYSLSKAALEALVGMIGFV